MTMIIEVTSRDWDVENVTNALALPAQRQYIGHLTVDDDSARTTFDGDVRVLGLHSNLLEVQEWDEDAPDDRTGAQHAIRVEDIRRVEFY